MFKSFLIPSLISLATFVGGDNVEIHSLVDKKVLPNSYETFYSVDREPLSFFILHGYGFKTNQALTNLDVDLDLMSDQAILVNLKTNEVIYEKDAHTRVYPASLTKMMTVLVGIEHMKDEPITINIDYNALAKEGAAIAGFSNGEVVSYEDLLYGTMLPSGADAALMLAKVVAGSEEGFVQLMNEKAKELGMNDTHFSNVTGLHSDDHYSTPWDLAMLEKAALYNEDFKKIFSAKSYVTSSGNLTFTSRMFDRLDSSLFEGGEILGGKTGYTKEAALCLASYATDGNQEYILVTTHANGSTYTPQYHVLDAVKTYDYFINED